MADAYPSIAAAAWARRRRSACAAGLEVKWRRGTNSSSVFFLEVPTFPSYFGDLVQLGRWGVGGIAERVVSPTSRLAHRVPRTPPRVSPPPGVLWLRPRTGCREGAGKGDATVMGRSEGTCYSSGCEEEL